MDAPTAFVLLHHRSGETTTKTFANVHNADHFAEIAQGWLTVRTVIVLALVDGGYAIRSELDGFHS